MKLLEIIAILELISRILTVEFQPSEWFYFEFINSVFQIHHIRPILHNNCSLSKPLCGLNTQALTPIIEGMVSQAVDDST